MFSDILSEMTIIFGHFKIISVYDRKKKNASKYRNTSQFPATSDSSVSGGVYNHITWSLVDLWATFTTKFGAQNQKRNQDENRKNHKMLFLLESRDYLGKHLLFNLQASEKDKVTQGFVCSEIKHPITNVYSNATT